MGLRGPKPSCVCGECPRGSAREELLALESAAGREAAYAFVAEEAA